MQSTSHMDAGTEMEYETDSHATLTVTSFEVLITGDELDSAVQFLNFQIAHVMAHRTHDACYM